MRKATSSAEETLGIKHPVVQQCLNMQRSTVQEQMSQYSQCESVMHLLAQRCESGSLIKCPEGDQSRIDRMAASCYHAAADWRKLRLKLAQMTPPRNTAHAGTGVQFTHGWDVVEAWEYRAVPSRLLKECNSDSSIRVCCAETQTTEGEKVVELGSSLLCGQSEDVAEKMHTALQVITCGASSVISGTCRMQYVVCVAITLLCCVSNPADDGIDVASCNVCTACGVCRIFGSYCISLQQDTHCVAPPDGQLVPPNCGYHL